MQLSKETPSLMQKKKRVIGWREWVALPDIGITKIKAKIDTGARSSSLHASNIEIEEDGQDKIAQFQVYCENNDEYKPIECRSKILEFREVKSSNGHIELRPVILSNLSMVGLNWLIELTLTNRDEMGFNMLIGRQSLRQKFVVDPGRSFLGNKSKGKFI